ncbi:dynamin family protein [Desulfonatronovibrio magnus]|uniref:dynamin family protein n=1 Tax=Desulfonatronovibrio magnus TaxID=698827 RepID=UPI0005EB4279|nr:dynamin family protein [Desulfonatronovibrio magnus]
MSIMHLVNKLEILNNDDIQYFLDNIKHLSKKTDIEIIFCGTVANGKSTLLNCLIKKNLLPAGLGATTSLITTIKYGPEDILTVHSNDGSFSNYNLTQQRIIDAGKDDNVTHLSIELKDFKHRGIRFIDSPGIDDISGQREGRSLSYVPLADAVVFVLDSSKGMTKEEELFFQSKVVLSHKDKIFIVLNKIDSLDENQSLDSILPREIMNQYDVFPVSALKFLAGILEGDSERIAKSKAEFFEKSLNTYINALDKKRVFSERVQRSFRNISKLADAQINALIENESLSSEELERKIQAHDIELKGLIEKKERLEKELNESIQSIQAKVASRFQELVEEINRCVTDVPNTEFMLDKLETEVPGLVKAAIDDISKYIEVSSISTDDFRPHFDQFRYLLLSALRNIDDIISYIPLIASHVPKYGKVAGPLATVVQDNVRKLVDAFGGWFIKSNVEEQTSIILSKCESIITDALRDHKLILMQEYEHADLGKIRAELVSLEKLKEQGSLEIQAKKEKADFYKKYQQEIRGVIDELLQEYN